jgi:hypothetical protein
VKPTIKPVARVQRQRVENSTTAKAFRPNRKRMNASNVRRPKSPRRPLKKTRNPRLFLRKNVVLWHPNSRSVPSCFCWAHGTDGDVIVYVYAAGRMPLMWISPVLVAASLAGTLLFPNVLIAWGPLVLGVPHVANDIRYLVLQPRLHRRTGLIAISALCFVGYALGIPVSIALVPAVIWTVFSRGSITRKLISLTLLLGGIACSLQFQGLFVFFFLHAHNFVAIGIWIAFKKRTVLDFVFLLMVTGICIGLWSGAFDDALHFSSQPLPQFFSQWPSFLSSETAFRLTISFIFLQAIHYGIWLHLIPASASVGNSLRADIGTLGIVGVGGLTCIVFASGFHDAMWARDTYLRLAGFHGFLELAVVAHCFVENKRPGALVS